MESRVSRLFKQSGLPVHSFDNEVMQLTFINDLCDTMKIQNYDEYIFLPVMKIPLSSNIVKNAVY